MNNPVKCPDCGLWWRTDTHKCEEKKAEEKVPAPFVKSPLRKNKGHNARAYCLSCHKSGTVYFEHECGNGKGYSPNSQNTWVPQYDYKITKKDYSEHDPKKNGLHTNKVKNSCKCGKDSK